jgi:hypothetical protein
MACASEWALSNFPGRRTGSGRFLDSAAIALALNALRAGPSLVKWFGRLGRQVTRWHRLALYRGGNFDEAVSVIIILKRGT